jgi:hypothetical protein
MVAQSKPHIAVLDLHLPDMVGHEVKVPRLWEARKSKCLYLIPLFTGT